MDSNIFEEMKKKYYVLPLDQFGQPNGQIETRFFTDAEAQNFRKNHGYIFEDYDQAVLRALD